MVSLFHHQNYFQKLKQNKAKKYLKEKEWNILLGLLVLWRKLESRIQIVENVHEIIYNWSFADRKKNDFFISRSFAFKLLQTAPFLFLHFLA